MLQGDFYGLVGQFRMVVVFAEVAQEQVFQLLGEMFGDEFRHFPVAEVSVRAGNPGFQVLRIRAHHQHGFIIIGFQNQVVRPGDIVCGCRGDMSDIGQERKVLSVDGDAIADVVGTVVRNLEAGNPEVLEGEGSLFLDVADMCFR